MVIHIKPIREWKIIRWLNKLKNKRMNKLELMEALQLATGRSEMSTILITDIKPVFLQMFRSSLNAYNEQWTDFNTDVLVNKVSDGHPIYVYIGLISVGADSGALNFLYRGNFCYAGAASLEQGVLNSLIIMDETAPNNTTTNLLWSFHGYRVDRGA